MFTNQPNFVAHSFQTGSSLQLLLQAGLPPSTLPLCPGLVGAEADAWEAADLKHHAGSSVPEISAVTPSK